MDKKVISSIRNTTIVLNNHFLFKFYSFEDKFLFILSNHLQSLFSSMNLKIGESSNNRWDDSALSFLSFSPPFLPSSTRCHEEEDLRKDSPFYIYIYICIFFLLQLKGVKRFAGTGAAGAAAGGARIAGRPRCWKIRWVFRFFVPER